MTVERPASVDVAGPLDGRPIVLLHGTGLSRTAWSPQLTGLADTYRVIAPDLPGHGALADRPFTLPDASAEVERVIEEVAGGSAVVVGLSLGGYVAMALAARRPELVEGLVLSGATLEPVGPLAMPFRALAWGLDQVDDAVLGRAAAAVLRRRYPPVIAEAVIAGGVHPSGGAQALRALAGERFIPRLAGYPGPTLLLNGELDVAFRLGARGFAKVAADARRVRLGGAGHLANLDRPAAFEAAIRHFLEALERRS